MYVQFESQNSLRFSKIEDRLTIGTAPSNGLVLDEKGIRPLHGQWVADRHEWKLELFSDSQTKIISCSDEFGLGPFRCRILSDQSLWERHQTQILDSFRSILKTSEGLNLEQSLLRLRRSIFCNRDIPRIVESHLTRKFEEFSLMGPIERLLAMEDVTDILVQGHDEIWIERRGDMIKSDAQFTCEENYRIYLENLLSRQQTSIDESHPFVDFILPDGSRGHIVGPPVTPKTPYLSIRRPREKVLSLDDLFALKMFRSDQGECLRRAIFSRQNILISGATGTGKTTLLKAILHQIPPEQRILIAEDTPELCIARENTAFLRTRIDARGQLPPIHLRELVRQALRMRPDRIVIGEVRGAEALDLLHAMNTGHRGCLGSLHANSARDALARLEGLVQLSDQALSETTTRDLIARNIHLVIHLGRSQGSRRIEELAFVRGVDQGGILLEILS